MFAVIIQSAVNSATIRQTVIIPGAWPLVFTRLGAGQRGVAGAWQNITDNLSEALSSTGSSPIVGEPTSIRVTTNDLRTIESGKFPATLLQKLVRAVKEHRGPSTSESGTEAEVIERIRDEATGTGERLVRYLRAASATPVITPAPRSVEQVVVIEHEAQDDLVPSIPATVTSGTEYDLWTELSTPSMSDPAVAGYVERKLDGGVTESQVYDFARARSEAVAVVGPAGTGKTSSARAYAAKRGLPFVVFECNPQVDEEVVQGSYIPTGHGTELVWRYSALATALARPSVVLLNESNRMTARANALFLAILQERELRVTRHKNETIKVHPECLIIADSNDGYRGTQKSDQAFLDRFNVKVEFAYDTEVEKQFIRSQSLLALADRLRREAEREGTWSTPVSTRILKNFVAQVESLGWDFASASFLNNFPSEERDALSMLLATYSANIQSEVLGTEHVEANNKQDVDELLDDMTFTF